MDLDWDADDELLSLVNVGVHLQIEIAPTDFASLLKIRDADWSERRSIRAGSAAGIPVWWCLAEQDSDARLLVGPDDETWFLALDVPLVALEELVSRSGR